MSGCHQLHIAMLLLPVASYQLPVSSCQLPVAAAATLCQSLFLVAHSNWPGVGIGLVRGLCGVGFSQVTHVS